MKYDTLIIGAGLSGLAAGIRLAYYEKRVCILERHTTVGGLNSFYRLRGRNHDVGLHAVTNYAAPGTRTGPLSKLLRQLRLGWDDWALVPQCGSAVVFGESRLRFNNDFELLRSEIRACFPDQISRFDALAARIDAQDDVNLRREPLSARAVVRSFITDRLLEDMLFCPLMFYGSATPHDMDFSQFAIMFKSIFREGFGRPREGVRRIMKSVTRRYKELGGELRLRSGVKSIRSDGTSARVELDSGDTLEADAVLSSAGSAETMQLLGERPRESDRFRPGEISFVETIFSLDCQPRDLGHGETIVFYNEDETFRYERPREPCDVRSGIICSPNNFEYDRPLDEGRVRITALADPGYWSSLDPEAYAAAKDEWCSRIVESAVRFMPEFRGHVVDTDVFTPKTITRFTGHWNGAVYGAAEKIVDGRTPFENVYICGTDQGFLGIIGSMLSGISIVNAYLLK